MLQRREEKVVGARALDLADDGAEDVDGIAEHAEPGVEASVVALGRLEVVEGLEHEAVARGLVPVAQEEQDVGGLLARGELERDHGVGDAADALWLCERIVGARLGVEERAESLEHLVLERQVVVRLDALGVEAAEEACEDGRALRLDEALDPADGAGAQRDGERLDVLGGDGAVHELFDEPLGRVARDDEAGGGACGASTRGVMAAVAVALLFGVPLGELVVVDERPLFVHAEAEHVAARGLLELVREVAAGDVEEVALVHEFGKEALDVGIRWTLEDKVGRLAAATRHWRLVGVSAEARVAGAGAGECRFGIGIGGGGDGHPGEHVVRKISAAVVADGGCVVGDACAGGGGVARGPGAILAWERRGAGVHRVVRAESVSRGGSTRELTAMCAKAAGRNCRSICMRDDGSGRGFVMVVGVRLLGLALEWYAAAADEEAEEEAASAPSTWTGVRPLTVRSYGMALSAASELNWRERFFLPKIESMLADDVRVRAFEPLGGSSSSSSSSRGALSIDRSVDPTRFQTTTMATECAAMEGRRWRRMATDGDRWRH
ncbi:hypothetical protein L1887_63110 [Cichorium endivia]|nr:hypothetical protein L1887_63110 [Cichorium endivia]